MDISGNKPPWDVTFFLTSPSVDDALLDTLLKTKFGPEWKEINHDEINLIKKRIDHKYGIILKMITRDFGVAKSHTKKQRFFHFSNISVGISLPFMIV